MRNIETETETEETPKNQMGMAIPLWCGQIYFGDRMAPHRDKILNLLGNSSISSLKSQP